MPEIPAADFVLATTLRSGQVFRWQEQQGWWYGYLGDTLLKLRQHDGRLSYETSDPAFPPHRLTRFLALDCDLAAILRDIDVDPHIHRAILRHDGLRILRQEPWECLASFILSSCNNIARLTGMLNRLARRYGAPVALNGFSGWTFPAPDRLARAPERRLRALGLGFRAPYLRAAARCWCDGAVAVDRLRQGAYEQTKAALREIEGVGDKVADCVALFAFEQMEAFPLDVWMLRVLQQQYRRRRLSPRRLHAFARRHFGRYAGYAQQYLYHDARTLAARNEGGGRGSSSLPQVSLRETIPGESIHPPSFASRCEAKQNRGVH